MFDLRLPDPLDPSPHDSAPDSLPPSFDVPRFLTDLTAAVAAPARDTAPLPRYRGSWHVALGTPGAF